MHSVDQVDVGMPARAKQHLGSRGQSAKRMRSGIFMRQVGLDFDDPPGPIAVNEGLAENLACHVYGRALVKCAWKRFAIRHAIPFLF